SPPKPATGRWAPKRMARPLTCRPASPSDPEIRSAHRAEHLLLVIHESAALSGDPGRVVSGDEKGVDVARRDGQPEVVADEAPVARGPVTRAGHLGQTVDGLQRFGRVPRILRDPDVAALRNGAAAVVLEGLQRGVDAEVGLPGMTGADAAVGWTGAASVVEGDRNRATRTCRDRGLELVVRVRVVHRVDVLVQGAGLGGPRYRRTLGECLPPISRNRDVDLGRLAVVDSPGGIDVILVNVALDVIHGDPLLVLNKADRKARVDRGL